MGASVGKHYWASHDIEQSVRDAAIFRPMYTPLERHVLVQELAPAMLAGGWTEDRVAESGASCLDRWPGWMTALAMRIMVVHPAPPVEEPGLLMAVIEAFLSEHPASEADARPPTLLRLMPARALLPASLAPGRPVVRVESVSALAELLELSDGQLAWLADARSLERVVRDERLRRRTLGCAWLPMPGSWARRNRDLSLANYPCRPISVAHSSRARGGK